MVDSEDLDRDSRQGRMKEGFAYFATWAWMVHGDDHMGGKGVTQGGQSSF
jgi:hypothetical protein